MAKPIRVLWSPLSERFYATRSYKDSGKGYVTVTGEKWDVTQDIAAAIMKHDITFTPINQAATPEPEKES